LLTQGCSLPCGKTLRGSRAGRTGARARW
jgi:hypothetical protein